MNATPFDFSGKAVIVTGGTKGSGKTIAQTFLQQGANVVVCGRTAVAELPQACGKSALFVAADVRDAEQVQKLIAETVKQFGGVDILINNAGGSPFALATEASPRFFEKIIALNLLGPLYVAQAANRIMQQQSSGGVIINIGSVSAIRPSPGTAAYGAAKAGLLNLTQSLAIEWAPKVRVNIITAGMILTEQAELHYGDAAGVAAVAKTVPLERLAQPQDIANACLYLASPSAAYISGANLTIHGGGERPAFLAAATANKSAQ